MAYVSQADKKSLAPAIKAVLNKYGMKGSIRVRNHSTLCGTGKSGAIDFSEYMRGEAYIDVNEYWIDQHYNGIARNFLNELLDAMKGPNYFNDDDAMTDYFHRSHYTDIEIGTFKKPYVFMGSNIPTELRANPSQPAHIVKRELDIVF